MQLNHILYCREKSELQIVKQLEEKEIKNNKNFKKQHKKCN